MERKVNPGKEVAVGDVMYWAYKEWDGKGIIKGIVTKIEYDHFILESEDGIHLWVDFEENRDESVTMKAFSNQEDAVSFIN